jgi:hypothetical protein
MRRLSILAVLGALVAGLLMPRPTLAVMSSNTIDPTAYLANNGRRAHVSGPIACEAGEQLHLNIVVKQESTGATAKGKLVTFCTGEIQQWSIRVTARGATPFEPGPATACASAFTRERGRITDTREWCRADGITLVGQ